MEHGGDELVGRRLAAAYEAHADGLYRMAVMILGDAAGAEDAVQQAFVKFAAMGERFAGVRSEEAYLRRAVRNECYRIGGRRGPRFASGEASAGAMLESAAASAAREDERRVIEAALRELPAEQREVVHLKVYEGRTFAEIAEELGVSQNTAASRYRYAMEKLRGLLARLGEDEVRP